MDCFSQKRFKWLKASLLVFSIFPYSAFSFADDPQQFRMFILTDIHLNTHKSGPSDINPPPSHVVPPSGSHKKATEDVSWHHHNHNHGGNNYTVRPSDLYLETYNNLLNTLKAGSIISQTFPKVALLLGDSNAHTTFKRQQNLGKVYSSIKELFANYNIPILNTFGNNDSLQTDYGPFQYQNQSIYDVAMGSPSNWRDGFLSSGKKCESQGVNEPEYPCINPLIPASKQYGYYTAYLQNRLKLIDLNTVMFDPLATSYYTEAQRQQELTWLQSELQSSVEKNENVILAMHIPPNRAWASSFNKILLSTKPRVITAVLAGHTHMNESHSLVSYNKRTVEQLIPLIVTPALSTVYGVASGFNILTIAQQNNQWVLQDISTYSFQQASANDPITLKNIYSFDQEYCPGTETTVAGCMQKNLNNEKYFTLLSQHYTNDNPNNQQSAQTRGWIWKEHHGGGGGGGNHHRHYHHR